MIGESGQSPSDIPTWRKHKRVELLSRRVSLSTEEHREKSAQILDSVWSMRDQITGIVGLYWPYKGEVDINPLMSRLLDHGHSLALPVVMGRGKPLQFKSWKAGDVMAAGVYGIPYPSEGAVVEPDTLIVPLLGFDKACYRLGYGGGFYDRTLAHPRKQIHTIGVGFEDARLETIFPQDFDVPLAVIITENSCMRSDWMMRHDSRHL